jgi:transposase
VVRGLLSDDEWAFFEPFVIERGPLRGRPPVDHRRTLDAVFWIARTGLLGAIFRRSSATGTRCTGNIVGGRPAAYGT